MNRITRTIRTVAVIGLVAMPAPLLAQTTKDSAVAVVNEFFRAMTVHRARWVRSNERAGVMHEFDARAGGGYRMSLFYPPNESEFHGKTSEKEDMVNVRFLCIVEAVSFVTTAPNLLGEMTLTATFGVARGGQ